MEDKTTILIVDDESAGQEALEGVLFSEGYRLIFASNGAEAYAKAVEYMPDLILLDVMMPGTDGFEACKMIRANSLIAEIPVIIVTALDDRDSRMKGIESGADDFLTKPFDRFEIRARVRAIVRLNRYRRLIMERVSFSWVVDQAHEGYVEIGADGNIVYSNPAARTLLDLPSQDVIAVPFLEHVKTKYHLEPEANWLLWPNACGQLLYLIQPETHQHLPVFLKVEILDLPLGKQHRLLLRIADATEELARQHELWSFHQVLSHKLQTPIAQFIMAAQLIHRQAVNPEPETIKELSEMMIAGGHKLEENIREILQYTRLSDLTRSGKKFALAELPVLIQQLSAELGIEKCRLKGEPTLKCRTINLSARAVDVIFRELMSNAKKFHPELAPVLEIALQTHEGNNLLITVADNGITLTSDQLNAVWQPYYQAEKVFAGNVSGMGLGLSSVANLVWEAGGKCRMYNRVGQSGIVVELILPLV